MIDAAGAIYVIGGTNWNGTYGDGLLQDVWASTDGGADRTRSKGGGLERGTQGVIAQGY